MRWLWRGVGGEGSEEGLCSAVRDFWGRAPSGATTPGLVGWARTGHRRLEESPAGTKPAAGLQEGRSSEHQTPLKYKYQKGWSSEANVKQTIPRPRSGLFLPSALGDQKNARTTEKQIVWGQENRKKDFGGT